MCLEHTKNDENSNTGILVCDYLRLENSNIGILPEEEKLQAG
jgi:hypothetical protein